MDRMRKEASCEAQIPDSNFYFFMHKDIRPGGF